MRFTQSGITSTAAADAPAAKLDDLKALLRLEGTSEDDYLTGLLIACTDYAQRYLNASLLTSQWTRQYDVARTPGLALEQFTNKPLYLTDPPVKSVDRVYTIDDDGNESEVTNYYSDLLSFPARVIVNSWGSSRDIASIRVDYTAGYGATTDDIPRLIQQGILQHAAYMYEHRGDCDAAEAQRKSGAVSLYNGYKVQLV
jgi:uncharacterized phiE125 gp8 family phage protein